MSSGLQIRFMDLNQRVRDLQIEVTGLEQELVIKQEVDARLVNGDSVEEADEGLVLEAEVERGGLLNVVARLELDGPVVARGWIVLGIEGDNMRVEGFAGLHRRGHEDLEAAGLAADGPEDRGPGPSLASVDLYRLVLDRVIDTRLDRLWPSRFFRLRRLPTPTAIAASSRRPAAWTCARRRRAIF